MHAALDLNKHVLNCFPDPRVLSVLTPPWSERAKQAIRAKGNGRACRQRWRFTC